MIPVGKILKTKGFDGTTIVSLYYPILNTDFLAFFYQLSGRPQPLLIAKVAIQDEDTALIAWMKYPTKELAVSLHNTELFMDSVTAAKHFEVVEEESIIGYTVYNHEEKLGLVVQSYENNFQETMEVQLVSGQLLLIPLIDEMVDTVDDDQKSILLCLIR